MKDLATGPVATSRPSDAVAPHCCKLDGPADKTIHHMLPNQMHQGWLNHIKNGGYSFSCTYHASSWDDYSLFRMFERFYSTFICFNPSSLFEHWLVSCPRSYIFRIQRIFRLAYPFCMVYILGSLPFH